VSVAIFKFIQCVILVVCNNASNNVVNALQFGAAATMKLRER